MTTSEKDLLVRWQSLREGDALAEIVRRHGGMVYAACRRMLSDSAEAEAVTQETFLALNAATGKEAPGHTGPWLHATAVDRCLQRLESPRRRQRREAMLAGLDKHAAGSQTEIEWPGIACVLDEDLNTLQEEFGAPIIMHFLSGLSHAEIAEETGVPRRTVSERIEMGLEMLCKAIGKHGVTLNSATLAILLATHIDASAAMPPGLLAAIRKTDRTGLALEGARASASAFLPGKTIALGTIAVFAAVLAGLGLCLLRGGAVQPAVPGTLDASGAAASSDDRAVPVPGDGAEAERTGILEGLANALANGGISGTVYDDSIIYHPERLAGLDLLNTSNKVFEQALLHVAHKPVPGVLVVASAEGRRQVALTDASGKYAFASLPAGTWTIRAERPSGAITVGEEEVEVTLKGDESRADVNFVFRFDGVSIAGRVVSTAGLPVAGALVTATHFPEWAGESNTRVAEERATVTDDDGSYRLDGLVPMDILGAASYQHGGKLPARGVYTITARAGGYGMLEKRVPCISPVLANAAETLTGFIVSAKAAMGEDSDIGEARPGVLPSGQGNTLSGIDFRLQPAGRISGHVIDSQGAIVAQPSVCAKLADGGLDEDTVLQPRAVPPDPVQGDAAGNFSLWEVSPGTYVFLAGRGEAWLQRARNQPVLVSAGAHIADLEVVVESPGEKGNITGVIADALSGRPVRHGNVRVNEVISPSEPNPVFGKTTVDGESGVFEIVGISPGTVSFCVWAEYYCVSEVNVALGSGQTLDMTVSLTPAGSICGTVMYGGAPVSGGVTAHRTDGAGLPAVGGGRESEWTGWADASGEYCVERLAPGEYLVEANAYLTEAAHRIVWLDAAVEAGRQTTLNIDIEPSEGVIEGLITFPEVYRKARIVVLEGNVPGLDNDFEFKCRMRAETSESIHQSGSYQIVSLPPGVYTLFACCYNRRDGVEAPATPEAWSVVVLEDGQVLQHDIELAEFVAE